MTSKLTLKIDTETIEKAKTYAQSKKTSLSKMVENYLNLVSDRKNDTIEITPLVKSLSGVIKNPRKKSNRELYNTHLKAKFGK
jgi:hypothetical protein